MGNNSSSEELSTAGIICIAAACYTALILILVLVRYILVRRGVCGDSKCAPCGSEEGPGCCSCCQSVAESDGCKCDPSLRGCLNKCCPKSKKGSSCLDVCVCDCISNLDPSCCTLGTCPASTGCDFSCQECQSINCCCFEIKIKQSTSHPSVANNMQSFRHAPPTHVPSANQMPLVIQNQPMSGQVSPSPSAIVAQQQLLHQPLPDKEINSQFYTNKAYDATDDSKDAVQDTGGRIRNMKSSGETIVKTKHKGQTGTDSRVRFTEVDGRSKKGNKKLVESLDSEGSANNMAKKSRKKKTPSTANVSESDISTGKEELLLSEKLENVTRPRKKKKVHHQPIQRNLDDVTNKTSSKNNSQQGTSNIGSSAVIKTNETLKRSLPSRPSKGQQKSQIVPEVLVSKPPKSPKRKT